jgi:AAA domain
VTGNPGADGAPAAPSFAEIDATDQEWLWAGYIPDALLTVVIAPPKASKTKLCVDLAVRISRGDVMPDGSVGGPAAPVILAALEDGSETSIAHKLRAARAELGNVIDASCGPDGEGLELTLDHVSWLRQVIAANPGARLVMIDTLSRRPPGRSPPTRG